jgi:phosphoglycolate phosphatase-like HAD superfamily hydrolase
MLILFDIDATLIATSGVGVHSLEDAGSTAAPSPSKALSTPAASTPSS